MVTLKYGRIVVSDIVESGGNLECVTLIVKVDLQKVGLSSKGLFAFVGLDQKRRVGIRYIGRALLRDLDGCLANRDIAVQKVIHDVHHLAGVIRRVLGSVNDAAEIRFFAVVIRCLEHIVEFGHDPMYIACVISLSLIRENRIHRTKAP